MDVEVEVEVGVDVKIEVDAKMEVKVKMEMERNTKVKMKIKVKMRTTHMKTTAWFSCLAPSRVHARAASSSAAPMALPSLAPLGPFVDEVYVFKAMMACEDN